MATITTRQAKLQQQQQHHPITFVSRGGGGNRYHHSHQTASSLAAATSSSATTQDAAKSTVSKENLNLLSDRGRKALERLVQHDTTADGAQQHVYGNWPEPGTDDAGKVRLADQVRVVGDETTTLITSCVNTTKYVSTTVSLFLLSKNTFSKCIVGNA